jgi:UDP-N-acetylmuramoyl-tripeptide--D-alanyl-D-alanine ligase
MIFNIENVKKIRTGNITINSKEVKKNSIFFAIKGKKTDGHLFAKEALKKRAKYVVVKKNFKVAEKNKNSFIKVKSPLKLLEQIAKYKRSLSNGIFIGITGSFGKTTLKFMLSYFLKKYEITYSSPKSFNNRFGLPLSLSNTPKKSKYNIFELGMSNKGEISKLCKILSPEIGVITNIGPAHLKNFKNLKEVCLAKAEVYDYIKKDGVVFLNKDDFYFNKLFKIAKSKKLKVVTFGKSKNSNIQLLKVTKKNQQLFLLISVYKKSFMIETKTINDSFVMNFLATLSICTHFKLNLKKIISSAKNFPIPSGRGNNIIRTINGKKIHIIDESYNANPISMKNAIRNFSSLHSISKKKIAIIGDMLELGHRSKYYHQEIGKILKNSNIDEVCLIGNFVKFIYQKIKNTKKSFLYKDISHFKDKFLELTNNKSIILIKGSNAIGLNKLINKC